MEKYGSASQILPSEIRPPVEVGGEPEVAQPQAWKQAPEVWEWLLQPAGRASWCFLSD